MSLHLNLEILGRGRGQGAPNTQPKGQRFQSRWRVPFSLSRPIHGPRGGVVSPPKAANFKENARGTETETEKETEEEA